jgi:predicted anti-sigma-YlaC factor YlaD
MTRNEHERAREIIALGEVHSEAQQAWLQAHLNECEPCRHYAEATNGAVRALRSQPLAADSRLVRATQMRVRFHASRLREVRERQWLVGMACLGVGLSATLTVPLLWRFFAWMGEWAGVSTLVWQTGFAVFLIAPALVASILLLARGTHLAHDGD